MVGYQHAHSYPWSLHSILNSSMLYAWCITFTHGMCSMVTSSRYDVADPGDWLLHIPSLPACGCYTSTLCHCSHALSSVQCWVITTRENKHTCKHSEVEFSHSNQCTEHHSCICQLVFSPLPVDQHCMRTRTYQRWSPLLQFVLHSMIACWGMYM